MRTLMILTIFVFSVIPVHAGSDDLLDLVIPRFQVTGDLLQVVDNISNRTGIRFGIEEFLVESPPLKRNYKIDSVDLSVRQILEILVSQDDSLSWLGTTESCGCPLVRLMWTESESPIVNPLNMQVRVFKLINYDIWNLNRTIYQNMAEFRTFMNPKKIQVGRPGSRIRGESAGGYRKDIRYNLEIENTDLRHILNTISCIKYEVSNNWYFSHNPTKEYPSNYTLKFF